MAFESVNRFVEAILSNPSNSLDKMETPANVVAFAVELNEEVRKQTEDTTKGEA